LHGSTPPSIPDIKSLVTVVLMRCVRSHSVFHEDRHYNVLCFATRAGAVTFMEKFGGEWFDPRERGKGANWNKWYKGEASSKK